MVIASQRPRIYGARYSVYVQVLQLCLEEKGVEYDLTEVDVFAPGGPPAEHLLRHPFGRIPAFEHGTLRLYETAPTCRYVDEAFAGPPLQPPTPAARARMGQAISILDNYAYRAMVWGIYVERIQAPQAGRVSDEARIEASREVASICLRALDEIAPGASWLAGEALTLADLHAAPMFSLFLATPDSQALIAQRPRLMAWWERVSARRAMLDVLGSPRPAS